MSSCIVVLYTTLLALMAGMPWQEGRVAAVEADPDRLYADRANVASAREAAALWSSRIARDPSDFASAWKLARAQYWIGGHESGDAQREAFERGLVAARRAASLAPNRPEGHFWLAANMGGLAESRGLSAGLRYRSAIRDALERVLAIDPAFQQGSADRALGRWYYKVPRLFGGSRQKSEMHLRKALTYNPLSTATWSFLADTLFAMGRTADGCAALRQVLDAPVNPEWAPEDRDFKQQARGTLKARCDGED